MKKIFLLPLFTPLAFLITWGIFLAVIFIFFPEQKFKITESGEIIEKMTHGGFILLIAALIYFLRDFKTKNEKISWVIFLILSISALLREMGIQHHLSSTDTTPFKSKFFLNPSNPLSEKILYGLVLLIVFGMIGYLAVKYTKHLITSFFKMNTVTWSTAVLCCTLVFAKFADRFPANYRHSHAEPLSQNTIEIWSLLEESSEVYLPLLAIIILWQYHLIKKIKK